MNYCKCGCGGEIAPDRDYVRGHWCKGKHLSDSHKAAIKLSCIGHNGSPGIHRSKDTLDKISASCKLKWADPVAAKRRVDSFTGVYKKPMSRDSLLKRSNSMKNLWSSAEFRNKMAMSMHKYKSGYFISYKNNCSIFYASSYEEKAYVLLESDSTVLRYGRCCFGIPYLYAGQGHMYYPDILVQYIDGTLCVIEVKMQWELDRYDFSTSRLAAKLREAEKYCRDHDMQFNIWTESTIPV